MSAMTGAGTVLLAPLRDALKVIVFLPVALATLMRGAPLLSALILSVRLLSASLPIVFVVVFFSGAMLTIQAAGSLEALGGAQMAGVVVGFGGMREVFPLLAAASVAARTGAELASEIGAMRATQQIDALEVMGLDPMRLIVAPRLIACIIGTPLCVLVACGAGMLGAHIVGHFQLGIDRGAMWTSLWSGVGTVDIVVGAGKGVVLGFLLGAVSVREGLEATGGAAGVGRAANRAVIRSMVTVCSASLFVTWLIYGVLLA
jgi:phospholipid/cholesterol/gamma-HCH transport system permease protein